MRQHVLMSIPGHYLIALMALKSFYGLSDDRWPDVSAPTLLSPYQLHMTMTSDLTVREEREHSPTEINFS